MTPIRIRLSLLGLAAMALASCGPRTETWGFVATLGNDTTSVERVTRTGNRVSGEQVGRSPEVVHRRWSETFAPDGSLLRWTMDTHIPNAPAGQADLHHELIFSGNTVRVIRRTRQVSVDKLYFKSYPRTVAWNAFVYATFEDLFQAARGLPDTTHIGTYFFEGWEEGHTGFALVQHLPNGLDSVYSTGLAGLGAGRMDEQGRMLSYSGANTTYKQEVHRIEAVPDIAGLVQRFAADEKARGVARSLSPRDTMRTTIGRVRIAVDYSRPAARGRTLVGGLIPYDEVWRTGANAATQLTVSAPITLAGVPLRAGTYTLWTLPTRTGVQLIINAQTGQWGTEYDPGRDIARRPMQVTVLAAPVERFTIRVDSASSSLVMEWGSFRWSAPIEAR